MEIEQSPSYSQVSPSTKKFKKNEKSLKNNKLLTPIELYLSNNSPRLLVFDENSP